MKKWAVGDTIKLKDKGKTIEGEIEHIDKVITLGEGKKAQKRQWATVLTPATITINKCTHDIRRRQQVNLLLYKPPKKMKKETKKQKVRDEDKRKRRSLM